MARASSLICFAFAVSVGGCSKPAPRACEPPRAYWKKPHNFNGLMPELHSVSLTHDGQIYWNGERVSPAQFGEYLKASHKLVPEPNVFLQTEMGVSCSALERVRDQMDEALECKKPFSQCAEGIKSVWDKLPSPQGTPVS